MNDLKSLLTGLIDQLLTLKDATTDEGQKGQIDQIKRILFTLLDEALAQELDANDTDYKNAVTALTQATNTVNSAIADIKQAGAAIADAVTAAKLVDKALGLFATYLK